MSDTTTTDELSPAEALSQKIQEHAGHNWVHKFSVDDDKRILPPDNLEYRNRVLQPVFASLLAGRSVLVLDDVVGIYPALLERAGAGPVTASSPNSATCELMAEVWEYLGVSAHALNSRMVAFYDAEPYVDKDQGEGHEFLVALNQIWPMFGAAGQDFDGVVEACAFMVTDGLIFDWTNAQWAKPPPPPEYNREAFAEALGKKFEYVTTYSDWLIVATGKLPV